MSNIRRGMMIPADKSLISDASNLVLMLQLRDQNIIGQDVTKLYAEDLELITSLPNNCFANCNCSLTELKYFTGLTSTPDYLAYANNNTARNYELTLELPSTITTLGKYLVHDRQMFRGPLIIPEGVSVISLALSSNCYKLHRIELPSTTTSIESGMLARTGWAGRNYSTSGSFGDTECYAGITIVCKAVTPPTVNINNKIFNYNSYDWTSYMSERTAIYVPDESVNTYKTVSWWSDYADYIHPISEIGNAPKYEVN